MKIYQTKSKECILNYLKSNSEYSFSVQDIYSYLQKNDNGINLTTVYRNLDKLVEMGKLIKIKSAESDCNKYQYIDGQEKCCEHLHMQCRECGKLYHLECDFMNELASHMLKHYSFVLESPGSMLCGVCQECKK